MMLKKILMASAICAAVSVPVTAEVVPQGGMMFCENQDELAEFFMAVAKKNTKWAQSLDCLIIKKGVEYVVLEELGSFEDKIKSAKVRVFEPGKSRKSYVGYAVIITAKD